MVGNVPASLYVPFFNGFNAPSRWAATRRIGMCIFLIYPKTGGEQ